MYLKRVLRSNEWKICPCDTVDGPAGTYCDEGTSVENCKFRERKPKIQQFFHLQRDITVERYKSNDPN